MRRVRSPPRPVQISLMLDIDHTTAILDHDKPRARYGTLIDLGTIDRCDRVLASPHQQGWSTDAGQQMTQREAVHVGLPCRSALRIKGANADRTLLSQTLSRRP